MLVPNENIRALANTYLTKHYNRTLTRNYQYDKLPQDWAITIADYYDSIKPEQEYNQATLEAYASFKLELKQQYQACLDWGITFVPWKQEGQPYADSDAMRQDVADNNRLYFFLTDNGFGETEQNQSNPLLELTEYSIDGHILCYNDLFRCVHDIFGHCIEGYSFGARGETNAWLEHLDMFVSKGARFAISTEAQGQTCWFNYGKHVRRGDNTVPTRNDPDYWPMQNRPYADQKIFLFPVELLEPMVII